MARGGIGHQGRRKKGVFRKLHLQKFEGRGSGRESSGCCVLFESALIFTVCIDRA